MRRVNPDPPSETGLGRNWLMWELACLSASQASQLPQKSTCSVHANPQPTSYSKLHAVNCGSGLARECGVSVTDKLTDTPHSRASPLPHLDRVASGRLAFALHLIWLFIQPLKPSFWHTEPKRGAEWWGEDFLVTFVWAGIPVFTKVTRRQGGTLSSHHRSNRYTHQNPRQTNPHIAFAYA